MSRGDSVRCAELRKCFLLKPKWVFRRAVDRMKLHVEQSRSREFHCGETGIEVPCGPHFLHQRQRNRLPGLHMPRMRLQDFGNGKPVLVKLGWQFNEITRNCGPGDRRPGHVTEKAVKRMAKLVEQRACVINRQQSRLASRRLRRSEE